MTTLSAGPGVRPTTSPPRGANERSRRRDEELVERNRGQSRSPPRQDRIRRAPRVRERTASHPPHPETDSRRQSPADSRAIGKAPATVRGARSHSETVCAGGHFRGDSSRPFGRHPDAGNQTVGARSAGRQTLRRASASGPASKCSGGRRRGHSSVSILPSPAIVNDSRACSGARCAAPICFRNAVRLAIAAEQSVLTVVDGFVAFAIDKRRRAAAESWRLFQDEHAPVRAPPA
jgi:hypothetical protein